MAYISMAVRTASLFMGRGVVCVAFEAYRDVSILIVIPPRPGS